MRHLPIELDVADRDALVIGSNPEVLSKIDRLLRAGARVAVIAPGEVHPAIEEHWRAGRVALHRRVPELSDLAGKAIVFLAAGDDALSRLFFEEASRTGRLVCTLDRPEVSTFVNPAVAHAPGLTMSFSTGGASPSTARRIREDLEALFSDPRFARYMDALRKLRSALPRGERAERMKRAAEGFAIEARLRFPAWLERGEEP